MATQRKTIPIKQHNRLVNKHESQLFKQLGDITKLGEKILDLETKIKVLEEALESQRKSRDEDDRFYRNRDESRLLVIENLTNQLEQAKTIILSLGRIIQQNDAHVMGLRDSIINNYHFNNQPFNCNATDTQKQK